jgi:glycosyltransferase involved in cell wall biosynthesis
MARGKPVIAVSQFIAEMVAERHGVDSSGIVTIPRGADLSVFDRDKVHTERIGELVTSWNLADEVRPIFMLPGRLTRWKGQEVFVDACKIVRERRGPDAFLGLIVGDAKPGSDYVRSLDRRIAASGSGDSIRIVGSCNDMAAAYRLASCVVSASTDPEAFGRVAVEAQAMGCPVIATNHGGGRETVEDDVTGILVEPGNAEAMANAMEEILDLSEEERSWVFDAATARVAEHFSTERMQQATLDVYESVLGSSFARR